MNTYIKLKTEMEDKLIPTKSRLVPSCLGPSLCHSSVQRGAHQCFRSFRKLSALGPGFKEEIRHCSFVYHFCDLSSHTMAGWKNLHIKVKAAC